MKLLISKKKGRPNKVHRISVMNVTNLRVLFSSSFAKKEMLAMKACSKIILEHAIDYTLYGTAG